MKEVNLDRRKALLGGLALVGSGALALGDAPSTGAYAPPDYADKDKMVLPKTPMELKRGGLGLLVVNPQIDFLSPKGVGWNLYGASIKENNTTENILLLLKVAKSLKVPVFVSYIVWNKLDMENIGKSPLANFIRGTKMTYTDGHGLDGNDIANTGADFLPELKPFILDNETVLGRPRKRLGLRDSDLIRHMRIKRVKQVLLCGMDANTHVDSHLRDLIDEGFEVGVARDAIAGAKLPEGDGYLAGLVNFRFLANELFFSAELVERMQGA